MIFVDTGVWFALFVEKDPAHQRTIDWFESVAEPLATSDYVIDETLTLLLKRNEHIVARSLGISKIASFDQHFMTTGKFQLLP